jgi:hypothetical protein
VGGGLGVGNEFGRWEQRVLGGARWVAWGMLVPAGQGGVIAWEVGNFGQRGGAASGLGGAASGVLVEAQNLVFLLKAIFV